MQYALLVDYEYCTGCHSCEIACNQEYNRPLGMSGIKVFETTMEQGDNYRINYMPVRTDLCTFCTGRIKKGKKPACVQHCLSGCLEIVDKKEITDHLMEVKRKQMIFL